MDLVSESASVKPALVQGQLISIHWHLLLHTTCISSQLLSSTFLSISYICSSLIHLDQSFSLLLTFPLSTNDHNNLKLFHNNICTISKYFSCNHNMPYVPYFSSTLQIARLSGDRRFACLSGFCIKARSCSVFDRLRSCWFGCHRPSPN